jgi:hypothetical protein
MIALILVGAVTLIFGLFSFSCFAHMPRGKILRIMLPAEATIVWSTDDWARTNKAKTANEGGLNLWIVDFPTEDWPVGTRFTFTCFWQRDQRWQGQNWRVEVYETNS